MITFAPKSVPRSFDSLRSLRMTTAFVDFPLCVLFKADNHQAGNYKRNHFRHAIRRIAHDTGP